MPRGKGKGRTRGISESEERKNEAALDAAAGVASPAVEITRAKIPPPPPEPEKPLLVADTREKLLYRCALQGPGISKEFFDEFRDSKELADLTCMLGIRHMAKAIVTAPLNEVDMKDFTASLRILLNIAYGETASTDPNKFLPALPQTPMPTGATDGVDASLEKIRKLSGTKT